MLCPTGGHKGRPYNHAPDAFVGAGFIPARAVAIDRARCLFAARPVPFLSFQPEQEFHHVERRLLGFRLVHAAGRAEGTEQREIPPPPDGAAWHE